MTKNRKRRRKILRLYMLWLININILIAFSDTCVDTFV